MSHLYLINKYELPVLLYFTFINSRFLIVKGGKCVASGKYNHFIKDYETIRSILKNIYIYGCYNKEQLINIEKIKGKKYDNESRRIRYFLNSTNRVDDRINGKKVLRLKYDRYDNIANFLVKSYKTKTFNSQDINLYFFILQILSREKEELSINKIMEIIQDEVLDYSDNDSISYRMLRDKLNELDILGFVEKTHLNPLKCKLVKSFLEIFTPDELNAIHQVLYFYRSITLISVPAYFVQESIKNHLLHFQGDDFFSKDVFLFKHTFLQNILNDEVIYKIFNAQNSQNVIKFVYDNKTKITITVVPLKIIIDHQYGRQYLFCYNLMMGKPQTYKLDKISGVQVLKDMFMNCDYESHLALIGKCWSMTQLNDLHDPMTAAAILVEIDFNIKCGKEYIRKQLLAEKRQGNVTELNENHWLFSIEVLRPLEMIPWIRSFGEFAKVRRSENHDLAQRIETDWQEVLSAYGII